MHERRPVEADEQPRLADVLAGEAGQERAKPGGEGPELPPQHGLVAVAADDDEVDVGELVHAAGGGGARGEQADDAGIRGGRGGRGGDQRPGRRGSPGEGGRIGQPRQPTARLRLRRPAIAGRAGPERRRHLPGRRGPRIAPTRRVRIAAGRRARLPHPPAGAAELRRLGLGRAAHAPAAGARPSTARMPGHHSAAEVTTAPITPAATSVACAPIAALTGPVSANDSGSRPIEISQSRLETRPSRCAGHVALLGRRPDDRARPSRAR